MAEVITPNPLNLVKQVFIVLGAYVTAEIFLVACAYLWVFIYSMFIDTGGNNAYYEAYAQISSPVVAVLLAGPAFFVIGRFMA